MKLSKPLFFFSFIFLLTTGNPAGVHASAGYNGSKKNGINGLRPTKLFVFGDSYADTGNNGRSVAFSWKQPYGITFPGKPSGRFSDGRVLTDFIARFLGVKSPIPYKWMKYAPRRLQYGVNFAFGGTGVFDTPFPAPNMNTQIDFLHKLINDSVYTNTDLQSSMALVTLAGNDYATYLIKNGTNEGLSAYISTVVNKLAANMKRLHDLGVKKVSVTSLEPLGCLPRTTVRSSFRQCNDTENMGVALHNSLLQETVARLNSQTADSPYFILDLFSPFITVIKQQKKLKSVEGGRRFETPLKPCCMGVSEEYKCSDVDKKGMKMYTICSDPNAAFFWDHVHPTQAGWRAVYDALKATLHEQVVF
ncbi:PREDICTED: GDSL esterase/lipase At5g03610-like isoform X2 [Ipomoea nil]|uniref:GDSL esterase/lipase At5g03610-like isoform X2 n=1 Tax=Ipomoea nil TaxID=35883 RepID=UPI00090105FA|nr:PREDICTED: GDSL esterase/lipase At5g03610-like isoform X2 [Ipomoea nil]